MPVPPDPHEDLRTEARKPERVVEFLLREYELRTESMLRNEDSGEKRAAFFLTLTGAAGAVLAFTFGDHGVLDKQDLPLGAAGAAVVLLMLGLMTMRRMAERHVVTDRHLFALRDIRRAFVSRNLANAMSNAFLIQTYEPHPLRKPRFASFHKGGWMESVAAVNAILAGVCVSGLLAEITRNAWIWLPPGILSAAVGWIAQITLATRYVAKEAETLRGVDAVHRAREG